MLPKRLELRNFLAYRNPAPINFEDLHLACLIGPNGAGKSSLLDAITWVLWGKARSRSDDDLIHLSESEMQVMLDFTQDGALYRIVRKRKMGKARKSGGRTPGQSELNLFSYRPEQKAFALISEPSMRETQAKINAILHLEYELFINSAFLQQGQADLFTTQTPSQRKEVLGEILGLERWRAYEESVKAELSTIQHELGVQRNLLESIEEDIKPEAFTRQELEFAKVQREDARVELEAAEALLSEIRGADKELRSAHDRSRAIEQSIHERERDIESETESISRHERDLLSFEGIMAEAEGIQQGHAELEAARQADRELGHKLSQTASLNERMNQLEGQLSAQQQELELELRECQTNLERDGQIIAGAEEIQNSLAEIEEQISALEDVEALKAEQQEQISKLRAEGEALNALNESLREEMFEIKKRLEVLEASEEAICPVCGQPLDESNKQKLISDMAEEGKERGDNFRANKNRQDATQEEIKTLTTQIREADKSLAALPRLRNERGKYQQQMTDIHGAETRLIASQSREQELGAILAEGRFGEAIRQQIVTLQSEREALDYDSSAHDAVREKVDQYLRYQEAAQNLRIAQESVPRIQAALNSAQARQARWLAHLAELQAELAQQNGLISELEEKYKLMKLREEEVSRLRSRHRSADEKVISLEQLLSAILHKYKRRAEIRDRQEVLLKQEKLYEQLRKAFGRNGIPAMMIEAAIPELEDAANHLLGRMTNNRMHLRFDTQRERKSGGMIETLDILIADELGTRDYNLYSGGEAFRVNFALRIALSQMLARRAGAQLRTLFIDEGFGTQDEAGRERLIEALNSIQDDFDLILVITHIEELKDAFPARIEVIKTHDGSLAVIR